MITKERLEETIRGVISEFKQTKQLTESAADELTAALGARVEDLFDQHEAFRSVEAPAPASDAEFEADMQTLAEGTDHLPPNTDTYSRADIYFDHD